MTRGRAATPDPFDLGAVAGSDELFEALSTRRLTDLTPGRTDEDPAAAMLAALVADVDVGAPPLPAPAPAPCGMPGSRRRGVRVVVAFGVAALVLTSAGAAAAGGGDGVGALKTTHGPARYRGAERSNENVQKHVLPPEPTLTDHRPPARHDPRHAVPDDEPRRAANDQPLSQSHQSHRPSRGYSRPPVDIHQSPHPEQPSTPTPRTPTPPPEEDPPLTP